MLGHPQCLPQSEAPQHRQRPDRRATLTDMHPSERVRFAVETAKAVLDGRLSPDEGAAAVVLQAEQVAPLLRSDRDSVTRSESESVATQLRMLAEQINDQASGLAQTEDHTVMARALGEMAQALR
jgi:hypothetical protein